MLAELARAPRSVQDLARTVGLSQPLASHHLKVLRDAGLVTVQRRGRTLIHSAVDGPVTRLVRSITPEPTTPESPENTVTITEHPTHDEHTHDHGEGCGHVAIPHGDHVDYAHEGHLHRAHDGHWDECETADHTTHDGHDHAHGTGCGHVAVPHRDHVDYLHDGHRHAAHEDHYDEH
jgi:DNA-binding transcriptional ArsR family regulator